MKYLYIIEKGMHSFSAYVPDLPGCVSSGKTKSETERLIKEAIEFHIEGLIEDGDKIPESTIEMSGFYEFKLPIKSQEKTKHLRKVTA